MKLSHAILGAGVLVMAAAAATLALFPPAVVASVDIEKVFANIAQTKANEAAITRLVEQLSTTESNMNRDLDDMRQELTTYTPGSQPYNEVWARIQQKIAELRAQTQFSRVKAEAVSAAMMREMYERLKEVTAAYAKEQQIDYVIINDSLGAVEETGLQGTKQQIALRRFLFANPAYDVTNEIVARLDADFKARPSTAQP